MGSERYLALALAPEGSVDRDGLVKAANREAVSLLGDAGAAALDLWVYDVDEASAVVGCGRDAVGRSRAALACVTRVERTRVAIVVAGVSGTIRKARTLL